MDGIIYVFHGSKVKEANEQAIAFIHQIIRKVDRPIQEIAFLEKANPTIPDAFENCVRLGAKNIIVIPVLLLTAAHIKEDIPNEINNLLKQYPEVKASIGKAIGVHEKLIEILVERLDETQVTMKEDAAVLLVGRGSSDPDVKTDLICIGDMLQKKIKKRVGVCFLAAAQPSLSEGLDWAKKSTSKQTFVIPYLLFTGVLMKKLEQTIDQDEQNDFKWILCPSLGYHPILEDIILEQIHEMLIKLNTK